MTKPHVLCVLALAPDDDSRLELERLSNPPPPAWRWIPVADRDEAVRLAFSAGGGVPTVLLVTGKDLVADVVHVVRGIATHCDGCCSVIALADDPELNECRAVLRAGADDYLDLGMLTPQTLAQAVERVAERHRDMRDGGSARERPAMVRLVAAVRENEERTRLALTAARTGIWTWDWITDSVEWSPECYVIHGVGRTEFDGTGEGFFRLVHPEDRAHVESSVRSAVARRAPYSCEFRVVRPDGEVVWVENLGSATYGEDGEPNRMLGTITDVSARKRAEAALAASEARLARAQEAARVGTWDWEVKTGTAHWTNEAYRLFGRIPPETVTYELWESSLHPDDRARAAGKVLECLERGHYFDRFRVVYDGGRIRWLESEGETIFDSEGRPARLLGTVRDVTEQHEAEQALRDALSRAEQAARARERLLSVVSHDLRSPLQAMTLAAQILQKQFDLAPAKPDLATRLLSRIARQAKAMENLVDELLDLMTAMGRHPMELKRSAVDLSALARNVVEQHQAGTLRHRLEVLAPPEPVRGMWDERRLERVINNLISNAIKYSPAGGRVTVEVAKRGAQVSLTVSDEGVGIPSAELDRIFEWFARGENARASRVSGNGIGLAGVRQVVEHHGGSIEVRSQPGAGSAFTVTLPLEMHTGAPLPPD